MKPDKSILVIDDEDSICLAFSRFFEGRGWDVRTAATAGDGMAAFRERPAMVVFLDVRLPDRNGLELLEELGGADVIVITAYGDLDTVIRAMQGKAYDYLVKPLDLDKALSLADRAWQAKAVADSDDTAPDGEDQDRSLRIGLIGNSSAMQDVYKRIARAAVTNSPVLIQGETGTGKELVARAIHAFGRRRSEPFIAINCGAIQRNLIESELFGHVRGAFTGADADRAGKFELANGGCLLLDEIGDLPLDVQVKLLRVLDTGAVERVGGSRTIPLDVRILAATNKNLAEEVSGGQFRQDLYYRLAVLTISLPALRERKEDIRLLASHFLRQGDGSRQSLGDEAVQTLMRHDWPGNVRELKNAIQHAAAVAPDRAILAEDLPESVRRCPARSGPSQASLPEVAVDFARTVPENAGRYSRTIEEVERALIACAMELCGGNQSEAASWLGLHRNTLRKKIRQYGLDGS